MKDEVRAFLNEFHQKMKIWDILFISDKRAKNTQAIFDLEITSNERKKIIEQLTVEDFSQGPLEDKAYMGSDLWVFGKRVKGLEVYIKISMGSSRSTSVICISFHESEHEMKSPLKNH